jgi:hypothetical protein
MAEISIKLSDEDVGRIAERVAALLAPHLQSGGQGPPADALLPEPAAAAILGVEPHVLRDARKRHEIDFHRVGKFVRYSREQIDAYKHRTRQNAT